MPPRVNLFQLWIFENHYAVNKHFWNALIFPYFPSVLLLEWICGLLVIHKRLGIAWEVNNCFKFSKCSLMWSVLFKFCHAQTELKAIYANDSSRCFRCPDVNNQWLTAHVRATFNCSRTRGVSFGSSVKSTCIRYKNSYRHSFNRLGGLWTSALLNQYIQILVRTEKCMWRHENDLSIKKWLVKHTLYRFYSHSFLKT